jgi:hypothetical protein
VWRLWIKLVQISLNKIKSTQPPQAPLPEALNLDAWTEAEMTRQMISPLTSEGSPVREYPRRLTLLL